MIEKALQPTRIKILEMAIEDSLDRVEGSTNVQYISDQSLKREQWQIELDELRLLNPPDPRPSGKFEMEPEVRDYNAIFIVEKWNDGMIRIDIKKNRYGRIEIKTFDRIDEALEFIRDLLNGS